jgi:hypothetical protein
MALLPLKDEEAGSLLASIPEEARHECWWLILRDGTPVAGHHGGGVRLLAELELTRPVGRLLGGSHLSSMVDALDTVVSRYRKTLSRVVPDGPAPRRYP